MRRRPETMARGADGRQRAARRRPAAAAPFVFFPYLQVPRWSMALHVKAPGAEAATLQALPGEVRALDPDVALWRATRARDLVGAGLFPHRFAAQLVGAFGLVGLVLAGLGVYGVLAYQVARSTRELGVRRALGATSRRLVGGVVRQGGLLAAAGCAVGTAAGAGLALEIRSFLFGVRPLDPVTFTAVPAALLAVARCWRAGCPPCGPAGWRRRKRSGPSRIPGPGRRRGAPHLPPAATAPVGFRYVSHHPSSCIMRWTWFQWPLMPWGIPS